jgi:hypothetical protein
MDRFRLAAGTVDSDILRRKLLSEPFGHLAPAGIARAEEENRFHFYNH